MPANLAPALQQILNLDSLTAGSCVGLNIKRVTLVYVSFLVVINKNKNKQKSNIKSILSVYVDDILIYVIYFWLFLI